MHAMCFSRCRLPVFKQLRDYSWVLRPFIRWQLLLNYIPFAEGLVFKSLFVRQESEEVAAKLR